MWHSAKMTPELVALGVRGVVLGHQLADEADARGLEVAQEDDVVEVPHRVEVAEADALGVDVVTGHEGGRRYLFRALVLRAHDLAVVLRHRTRSRARRAASPGPPWRSSAQRASRWSLRIDSRRAGSRSPRDPLTAQPGSIGVVQSAKRQCAASATMSVNASSIPSALAIAWSRSPGVSMSSAPVGRTNSSRCVVAWRPRSSPARISQRELPLLAEQRVDERRLADAGHPEQRCRLRRARSAVEIGEAPAVVDAERGRRARRSHARCARRPRTGRRRGRPSSAARPARRRRRAPSRSTARCRRTLRSRLSEVATSRTSTCAARTSSCRRRPLGEEHRGAGAHPRSLPPDRRRPSPRRPDAVTGVAAGRAVSPSSSAIATSAPCAASTRAGRRPSPTCSARAGSHPSCASVTPRHYATAWVRIPHLVKALPVSRASPRCRGHRRPRRVSTATSV